MKIFYAVQATGNGHISRATEILPHLQQYGEVDIFLSGSNYSLKSILPVAYRSKGISLIYDQKNGAIDLKKTIYNISLRKIWNEAKFLPIEKYDLVINDFDCITSLACKLKKVKSIHLGHQASFSSNKVPRPAKKDIIGEWVLTNYANGTENIGFHFKEYDSNIYNPIIRNSIFQADAKDKGHITVYLGQYATSIIVEILSKIEEFNFEIFCKEAKEIEIKNNCKIIPVNQDLFANSLINCHGIITGAGFETPAEALFLEKKLMVVPLKGQYEQLCNAEALKEFNVVVTEKFTEGFNHTFEYWIQHTKQKKINITKSAPEIISEIIEGKPIPKIGEIETEWHLPMGLQQKRIAGN